MGNLIFFAIVFFVIYSLVANTKLSKSNYYSFKKDFAFNEAKYLVSLLAKIAKSDGRVDKSEANFVSHTLDELIFQINGTEKQRDELKRIFNIEKENLANTYEVAFKYKNKFNLSSKEIIGKIYFFLNIAFIDGYFSKEEREIISQICDGFGIDKNIQNHIFVRFEQEFNANFKNFKDENKPLKSPYEVLELKEGASFSEVKEQYRKLVRKYHPDILMGKGSDEEIIEAGTKKLQEINKAYEEIKKMEGR